MVMPLPESTSTWSWKGRVRVHGCEHAGVGVKGSLTTTMPQPQPETASNCCKEQPASHSSSASSLAVHRHWYPKLNSMVYHSTHNAARDLVRWKQGGLDSVSRLGTSPHKYILSPALVHSHPTDRHHPRV